MPEFPLSRFLGVRLATPLFHLMRNSMAFSQCIPWAAQPISGRPTDFLSQPGR